MMKGLAFSILLAFAATPISTDAESAVRGSKKINKPYYSQNTDRSCLHDSAKSVLAQLEARYGKVKIVKSCVASARMPGGQLSWHSKARGYRAFDFKVPKGKRQGEIAQWLGRVSPGVTISYGGGLSGIIHTDTGTFHKVIYRAMSHEAGEKAVAIWQERARLAALSPPKNNPEPAPPPKEESSWTMTAAYVEPNFELYAEPANIFQRFLFSKDIIVNPWVKTKCNGNKELPAALHTMLRDASAHFMCPVYVNSMYRDREYNRKVGGAPNSQHIQCRAVDFRVSCASPSQVRQWVERRRKNYGITFAKTYRSHVHTDNGIRQRYAGKKRKYHRYASAG